jgi:SAM-dependent methyltransferase
MTLANAEQFDAWNGDSGRKWAEDWERRDRVLAPVGHALLARSSLVAGEAVLDVGCGCGATTVAAAEAVTASGSAVGVDLSEPMLDVARRRAPHLTRATLHQADVQTQPLPQAPYDVVVSRFGTMFFSDPVVAFANIASAMRPRARLCMVTWQSLINNEWLVVPGSALLTYGQPPGTGGRTGMFAQSDPRLIETTLAAAGLDRISVEKITVSLRLGSDIEEATTYLCDTGPGRAILDTAQAVDRAAAIDAVRAALSEHQHADGVRLNAGVLITTARRPG